MASPYTCISPLNKAAGSEVEKPQLCLYECLKILDGNHLLLSFSFLTGILQRQLRIASLFLRPENDLRNEYQESFQLLDSHKI